MARPAFRVEVDGAALDARVQVRIAELRITLTADEESDSVEIRFAGAAGAGDLAVPAAEREIRAWLGWRGGPLTYMGAYFHDETDLGLLPRTLTVRAEAADLRSASLWKAPRTRSWDAATLGRVASDLAAGHGMQAVIDPALAARALGHVDQTAESDLHLIRRLARDQGATAKTAAGRLVLIRRGAGRAASGAALPEWRPAPPGTGRSQVLSSRVSLRGRPRYASVVARYLDYDFAGEQSVRAGDGDPALELRQTYQDRATAQAAAAARLERASRQTATLDMEVIGDPSLVAETPMITEGWGGVDGRWSIARATHVVTPSTGYRTRLTAERVE